MSENPSPLIVMSPTAVAQAATSAICCEFVAVYSLKEQDLPTDGVALVKVESLNVSIQFIIYKGKIVV